MNPYESPQCGECRANPGPTATQVVGGAALFVAAFIPVYLLMPLIVTAAVGFVFYYGWEEIGWRMKLALLATWVLVLLGWSTSLLDLFEGLQKYGWL